MSIRSANGPAGGKTSAAQGSDQGEDQGENLHQYGLGRFRIAPTLVKAENSIESGNADGGAGGSVTAIFNNVVSTHCVLGATTALVSPLPVVIRSGDGGEGGVTGAGQGTDQGEDQGENVGQRARGGAGVAATTVTAINRITSGLARGGDGGNVDIVFNQYTQCVGAPPVQTPPPPSATGVQRDAGGNIVASFVTRTSCESAARQPIVIQAGNGGRGGTTGSQQGTDQGEDQGENIGQFAAGSSHAGPTSVIGRNFLASPDANGGAGRSITVRFHNYIDASCGSGGPSSASAPIVVRTGKGGTGGHSGTGQGSDQAEDQGENIGQFAAGSTIVGPVKVTALNSIVSGTVDGGAGGKVTITYNDFGMCAPGTVAGAASDERVSAAAGGGGAGGLSGRDQGADQAEDQGENIGQFARDRAYLGRIRVSASNLNRSASANGGTGGGVSVTFHAGGCAAAIAAPNEGVLGSAGDGGRGGETGRGQGSDQAEDQGENIAKNASGRARFGRTIVRAVNRNISGDAHGGNGGDIDVASGSCSAEGTDPRVAATAGSGGSGGSSGRGQGADQAEDQGENIGLRARSNGGATSVFADNRNVAGQVGAGRLGQVRASECPVTARAVRVSAAAAAAPTSYVTNEAGPRAVPPVDPDLKICRGAFRRTIPNLEVPRGAVCRLVGATILHDLDVDQGGTLIASGITVGHDINADHPAGLHIIGGSVGHSLVVEGLTGKPRGAQNAICGVSVGHNLLVGDSTAAAGTVIVGGSGCRGNRVGHDLQAYGNADVAVGNNRTGHDVTCAFNRRLTGRDNRAAHINSCAGKRPG
ncbi:MAG TPA: hypothetical protein VGJ53_06365 [Micromonosporaceae bacterium]